LGDRTILFSSDIVATKLIVDVFNKKRRFLEAQFLDAFSPENILKQNFNKIIVDNQDANLERINQIKKLVNKVKEDNLSIEFNFLVSHINSDKNKIFELTNLGGALFHYAQALQLRSLDDKK